MVNGEWLVITPVGAFRVWNLTLDAFDNVDTDSENIHAEIHEMYAPRDLISGSSHVCDGKMSPYLRHVSTA